MKRVAPPFTFFPLHTCLARPAGVVPLALGTGLVRAGIPVHQVARVVAATSLAFTFEFAWAPLVDGALTRRTWYVLGSTVMCAAGVATKGIMAYDVPEPLLPRASGFYLAPRSTTPAPALAPSDP